MSNIVLSPNMNLPVPVVGVEPGPDYAIDIDNCLTLLDAHDHTPGNGVQITPAGMNINSALTLQGNFLTSAAGVTFSAQGSIPGIGTIYESGTDLYFVDGLGNNVRITQSGGVAGAPGSISNLTPPASASYVAGTSTFVWQSNTNIAANMDFGSAILRNLSPNSTFGLTLSPPTLSSDYTLTLPTVPSVISFLTINNSGVISSANPFALAAKGDLIVGTSGASSARLTVGGDGQVLTADSTAPNGLSYQNPTNAAISTKTGNYTLTSSDSTIIADATSASFTLTLPSAASVPNQKFIMKRQDATFDVTHQVTISGTIDGATDWKLYTQNETLEIQSNGSTYTQIRHDTNSPVMISNTLVLSTGAVFAGVSPTSSFSSGVSTITVSSGTNINVGMLITDTSVPGNIAINTYVTSVAGTSIGLSKPTTGTASTDTLHFATLTKWTGFREGEFLVCEFNLEQHTAGTIGSGEYHMTMPFGLSIDSSQAMSTETTQVVYAESRASMFGNVQISLLSDQFQLVGLWSAFNPTTIRIIGVEYDNNGASPVIRSTARIFGSGSNLTLNNGTIYVSGWFKVPISGWKP